MKHNSMYYFNKRGDNWVEESNIFFDVIAGGEGPTM